MASVKIQNVEFIEMDNVKVTYVTGTEKIYQINKLPKTVATWIAAHQETETEPATVETVEQDMEPAATTAEQEPETPETIPEEKQELEPVKVPVLDLNGNRRTGGIKWDITQYIVYPVAGLLLTVAAYGVEYLARLVFTLAAFAGWMEPKIVRAAAAVRNAAHKVQIASVRAWNTVKRETPVIIEAVKAYMVEAFEFRREIIAQDKLVDEF